MKRTKYLLLGSVLLLNSCGLYKEYQSTTSVPGNVYGELTADTTGNIAATSWQEMFTDPQLQQLIATALANNNDVKTAQLNIEKAEINYKTSKLAYLPTVAFSPTGGIAKNGSFDTQYTYTLGMAANWQLDVFGAGITNAKRSARAAAEYARDMKQAVDCRLVSSVAQLYYQLLSLDQQLVIMNDMVILYGKTYDMVQTLFDAGVYNSPAVHQTKAEYESLKVNIIDLMHAIETTEHSLCKLLDEPYHHIARGKLDGITFPASVGVGVPADLMRYRPDVRAAERNIEMAYYNNLQAKGALYPSINLSANGGWMSNPDPKIWFIQGIGSLMQPIFQGGKLRANIEATKIDQQIALNAFRQTVIDASHEITTALCECKHAKDKAPMVHAQVESLKEAVFATQELMNNGTTSYIEVLTALQSLLKAEITETELKAEGAKALITLYAALGGGSENK